MMYYRGYLPPVECPRCGTLNNQVREACRYCNGPLENYCSDDTCDCVNQRNARFCKKCGQPTVFMQQRVFDERLCAFLKQSAKNYFEVNGDPDSPEAKAAQKRMRREYREELRRDSWGYSRYGGFGGYRGYDGFDDDIPEPPLEPDYIPYY